LSAGQRPFVCAGKRPHFCHRIRERERQLKTGSRSPPIAGLNLTASR
jgi:hypothetical protein